MRFIGNSHWTAGVRAPATHVLATLWSLAALVQAGLCFFQSAPRWDAHFWQWSWQSPWQAYGLSWPGVQSGRWWLLFTYAWVQGGIWHWLAVLLGLSVFGRSVEPIIGSSHLLAASLLGTTAGGLAHGFACRYGALPVAQPLWGALPLVWTLVGIYSTLLPGWQVGGSSSWLTMGGKMAGKLGCIRAKEVGWIAAGVCVLWWRSRCFGVAGPLAMLAALCAGWAYTRSLGFGGVFFYQRILSKDDSYRRRIDAMSWEEFLNSELNPVLEKIARRGIRSLTRAERQTLRYSRRKLEGP